MDVVSLVIIAVCLIAVCLILAGVFFRRVRSRGLGFLSESERTTILSSKHVRQIYLAHIPSVISIETKFKYPFGPSIVIDAAVIDGNLHLIEPEFQRAVDLRGRRDKGCVYSPDTEMMLRILGCRVGPSGRIQYGPVPFTPQALLDGVQYMAQASLSVYALST